MLRCHYTRDRAIEADDDLENLVGDDDVIDVIRDRAALEDAAESLCEQVDDILGVITPDEHVTLYNLRRASEELRALIRDGRKT